MPTRLWEHVCPSSPNAISMRIQEVCSICGKKGKYVGWQYSMIEQMGVYQRRTGFKPIGAHRPLADKLLAQFYKTCTNCGGSGLIGTKDEEKYQYCPVCKGLCDVFNGDSEKRKAVVKEILKLYPDALAKSQH